MIFKHFLPTRSFILNHNMRLLSLIGLASVVSVWAQSGTISFHLLPANSYTFRKQFNGFYYSRRSRGFRCLARHQSLWPYVLNFSSFSLRLTAVNRCRQWREERPHRDDREQVSSKYLPIEHCWLLPSSRVWCSHQECKSSRIVKRVTLTILSF